MNEIRPITPTTYEVELAGGDKVEIGEKEAVDFKPHLKLNRWGGECFIKVALPTTEKITPVIEAGKVLWRGQKVDTRFYPLEPTTMNELGGFEFEIILKEKPATNKIIFDIQAQGLRFSYQPPLTQKEIDAGTVTPDNAIGSYAVYHSTKKNNQYMTGKAFHIYRPMAKDALGNEAWCAIHIDGYLNPKNLTITVPQQFLDEASYPVNIDPDFGYTTIGILKGAIAGQMGMETRRGSAWTLPGVGAYVANYIRAYVDGFGVTDCDCKVFINQKDSGGAGTHGQIATKENLNCVVAPHWEQFTLSSEALTGGVVYILSIIGNGADAPGISQWYKVYWDSDGGAVASYVEGLANYPSPENPWIRDPEDPTLDYSIYCNYSEAPPEVGLENKSANMGAKMIAGKLI